MKIALEKLDREKNDCGFTAMNLSSPELYKVAINREIEKIMPRWEGRAKVEWLKIVEKKLKSKCERISKAAHEHFANILKETPNIISFVQMNTLLSECDIPISKTYMKDIKDMKDKKDMKVECESLTFSKHMLDDLF